MVRTQVQLTEEQAAAVRRLAHAEGVSMAEVIRQCVDQRLRANMPTSEAEIRRRALEIIGMVKDGPGDLSVNHDAYFAEAIMQDGRLD
ncbi:MAG: ribbon-helix-helix protein, CopG family [Armatimonadetes bacterium]|nr:ribbon-helix-helix protein, CopG family [Armatimonadota bacterium]